MCHMGWKKEGDDSVILTKLESHVSDESHDYRVTRLSNLFHRQGVSQDGNDGSSQRLRVLWLLFHPLIFRWEVVHKILDSPQENAVKMRIKQLDETGHAPTNEMLGNCVNAILHRSHTDPTTPPRLCPKCTHTALLPGCGAFRVMRPWMRARMRW